MFRNFGGGFGSTVLNIHSIENYDSVSTAKSYMKECLYNIDLTELYEI